MIILSLKSYIFNNKKKNCLDEKYNDKKHKNIFWVERRDKISLLSKFRFHLKLFLFLKNISDWFWLQMACGVWQRATQKRVKLLTEERGSRTFILSFFKCGCRVVVWDQSACMGMHWKLKDNRKRDKMLFGSRNRLERGQPHLFVYKCIKSWKITERETRCCLAAGKG